MKTNTLLLILFICLAEKSFSQVSSAFLKSVYIFSAIKYMEWPADDEKEFTIIVLGDSGVYDELIKASQSKKAGTRSIVVRKVGSISDLPNCHILFLTESKNNLLSKITDKLGSRATLLVTEDSGALKRGSDFNFTDKGEKIGFQLSEKSLEVKGIKVASALTTLADKEI